MVERQAALARDIGPAALAFVGGRGRGFAFDDAEVVAF
jgi:hypothetical protein